MLLLAVSDAHMRLWFPVTGLGQGTFLNARNKHLTSKHKQNEDDDDDNDDGLMCGTARTERATGGPEADAALPHLVRASKLDGMWKSRDPYKVHCMMVFGYVSAGQTTR